MSDDLDNARVATREIEAVLKSHYPDGNEALAFLAQTVTGFAKYYGATRDDFIGLMARVYDDTKVVHAA